MSPSLVRKRDRLDDSLNKDICVEVFPFRQAARIDGNNWLTVLVGSDEFDKLPSLEFLSDGILVGLKRIRNAIRNGCFLMNEMFTLTSIIVSCSS